ncbi:hypothetical protein [Mycobacterium sp. JS623]|uniref:hypothetical protein n=1 Tax=Mycobacterium sp. JS623 TaxID=212767 RepID=UPI001E29BD6E|nr:hypothetical protein [Mycobacterium sp. JS623]
MTASWEHCPPEINSVRTLLDPHAAAAADRTTRSEPTPITASADQHDQVQR